MSDRIVTSQSDVGTLVVYDPAGLRDHVKAPSSWWRDALWATTERGDGRLAAWPLGGKRAATRIYRVRVGTPSEAEQPFAVGSSAPAPLTVSGEEVFVGPVERLPGDGAGQRLSTLPEGGGLFPADPGAYRVVVHVLDWKGEERFWNEDNEPTADAPPDFVVELTPAEGEAPSAPAEPTPLLDHLPKKQPLASKTVTHATRPRPKDPEEKKPRRKRASSAKKTKATRPSKQEKVMVRARAPGQLGVGATVRHAVYGIGEVRFMRDGFPKVKVSFHGGDQKVDKSELTVVG
jgi:hypothetical protein